MRVSIASYARPEGCRDKTLAFLKRAKWPAKDIIIFVASTSEKKIYEQTLRKGTYGKIVVGKLGLGNQKNIMRDFFEEGEEVLFMDDDIESVLRIVPRQGERNSAVEALSFKKYAKWAFRECRKNGVRLWGIRMSTNAFFMSETATIGWLLISGGCYGEVNTRAKAFRVQRADGNQDDIERTLQHIREYGNIMRINGLAMKTVWYGPGGVQATMSLERRHANGRARAAQIAKKYKDIIKSVTDAEPPHEVDYKLKVSPTRRRIPMPLM